jgi:hypothetical protein
MSLSSLLSFFLLFFVFFFVLFFCFFPSSFNFEYNLFALLLRLRWTLLTRKSWHFILPLKIPSLRNMMEEVCCYLVRLPFIFSFCLILFTITNKIIKEPLVSSCVWKRWDVYVMLHGYSKCLYDFPVWYFSLSLSFSFSSSSSMWRFSVCISDHVFSFSYHMIFMKI